MTSRRLFALTAAGLVTVLGAAGALTSFDLPAAPPAASAAPSSPVDTYVGKVEVVRGPSAARAGAGSATITGRVFEDRNQNSRYDGREKGVAGAVVSNGREVTRTDDKGLYKLPVFDNMTVTVTQPSGYQVPVNEHNIAQFSYNHLPAGAPEKLRFGGIARPVRCPRR